MEKLSKQIESYREEMIKDAQTLMRIKSVEDLASKKEGKPFGEGPAEALEKALEIASRMGFKTVNMDGYVGYAEYGQGEDYIAILGHLDVVPEGDGWIYPPYAAEVHDGKLYGRGAIDDKGPLVAALYGVKAIMDLGLDTSKRIRVIFGANEETGCGDIPYYVEREKDPVAGFTPDAEFPVIFAEKGITSIDLIKKCSNGKIGDYEVICIKGGIRPNMVPDYCEAKIKGANLNKVGEDAVKAGAEYDFKFDYTVDGDTLTLKAYGRSAHGSTPEKGKNAIMAMTAFLGSLCSGKTELGSYLEFINKKIGFDTKGTGLGCNLSDEPSGDLSFNAGILSFEDNVINLTNNLRYPVTVTIDDVVTPMKEFATELGIEIKVLEDTKPLYYDKNNPIVQKLQKVYNDLTGEKVEPLAIGGGTYAKEMPNIVAFGPMFADDPDVMHQPNEYVDLEKFMLCAKIYVNAIYELAK